VEVDEYLSIVSRINNAGAHQKASLGSIAGTVLYLQHVPMRDAELQTGSKDDRFTRSHILSWLHLSRWAVENI
jgi:hypothetical protein